MSIPNLPVDFKDDILAPSNSKRKYQQTFNSDGSVSLEDVTQYAQRGSDFGASQVNQTNGAVNNIYDERILTLEEAALVTEPGFFVDAQVITEINASLSEKEPKQGRTNSGCYYKIGYSCFLHAADENAEDIIKNLPAAYRPKKAVTLSGWCYNENSTGWYPCIAGLRADGTWAYVSAINELGAAVPYYIYNTDQGVDRRAYFRLWLTGAWATNVNGA